ncbi:MAG TPA: hypothetical protein VK477_06500, partial [Acidobacteriota bacterium]|nr:hypothetical protein [Acidobacteriota bacterium]
MQGQTSISWNLAGGGNWNTSGNWSPANVPNSSTEVAIFNNVGGGTITFNSSATVGGITFNSSAGAYTISQSGSTRTLTLGSYGIQQNDDSLQRLTSNRLRLTLGAASTFAVNGTGNLEISTTGGTIATSAANT